MSRWTDEPPSGVGWYWHRKGKFKATIHEVSRVHRKSELTVGLYNWPISMTDGQWSDAPIPMPEDADKPVSTPIGAFLVKTLKHIREEETDEN